MTQDRLHQDLLSILAQVTEDPAQAQLTAEKTILWASRNGRINTLALASLVAGKASLYQQAFKPAIEYLQRANTLLRDLGDIDLIAESYYGLASVYLQTGEFSLAIEQLRKAVTWVKRLDRPNGWLPEIRIQLSRALMNLGYWSDAEQELLSIETMSDTSDMFLAEYQLLVLRLAFFRGDQRTVKEQLQLCRELIMSLDGDAFTLPLNYYSARYVTKYEKVKAGEKELGRLWKQADKESSQTFYLCYEAALDLLQSDYPKKGVRWLTRILESANLPLSLQQQVHLSLARFFVAHLSHESATEHFQSAAKLTNSIRESEINHQWARYQADEEFYELESEVAQHKKNNQILAQSNALLQAVNRIAMVVNASLDQHSMLRRLREQLFGWVDGEIIGIAELNNDDLKFDCFLDGDHRLHNFSIPLSDTQAWSVQAIDHGRILYDNDYVATGAAAIDTIPAVTRSLAFIPLKCENRIIGMLTLQSRQTNLFDARCISLLEYISPVIGIAFANQLNLRRTIELSGQINRQKRELKDVRQLMSHLVDHDELTGLPSRASLPAHFERWVAQAPFQCLLLKVSNLDTVNTELQLDTGDEVIRILGQRLSNRIRPDDLLVRMGADQFLILVTQITTRDQQLAFAQHLLQLTTQPLRAMDQSICAEIAIGVATYPEHGETLEEMLSMLSVAVSHAAIDESSMFIIE